MIAKIIGNSAEEHVKRLYCKKGYKIIARNYKTRFGELDIVATRLGVVAVIEVKSRSFDTLVPIHESITITKQRRVKSAALEFLKAEDLLEAVIRFDAVFITHSGGKITSCEIIEDAF